MRPLAQVLQPVKPEPPHCPYWEVVQPPDGALVVALAEDALVLAVVMVVNVDSLVELAGLTGVVDVCEPVSPPPAQEKTGGPVCR